MVPPSALPPAHRFYNSRLKSVYDSCVLPTKTDYAASHTIASGAFSKSTARKSAWNQTTFTPPIRDLPRVVSLSSPFSALVSTGAGAAVARKKTHLNIPEPPVEENLEIPDASKRKTPFKRAASLEGTLRTFKVKMLPTAEQVTELKRCFGVARRAYNWANARVKAGAPKNIIKLRTEWRQLPAPAWAAKKTANEVASSIQEGAIRQLVAAYVSNEAKRKKDPSHHYTVEDRTRKNYTEVINIDKDTGSTTKHSTLLRFQASDVPVKSGRAECLAFFGNNLKHTGGIRLTDSVRAIARLVAEGNRLSESGKIQWDKRTRTFHFIFTYVQPRLEDPDPTFAEKRVVSTDPGARAFHTWYSPTTGQFGELLHGAAADMENKCFAIDALQSRVARRKRGPAPEAGARSGRQRYMTTRRLKHKLAKMRRNLHGWMESAHYDSANFLLSNFDIIIEPNMGVHDMTQRSTRGMSSKNVRKMLTWSHYKFRERLVSAATRYAGRHVIMSTEPGTSGTCSNCGSWKKDLGTKKTYNCRHCGVSMDRDVAGARNNFFSEYGRALGISWDGVRKR